MKFKLAIFDIDCTLIVTGGSGMTAFKKVFEELYPGSSHAIPSDYTPHGRTDIGIFKDYVRFSTGREPREDEVARIAERYLELLPAEMERDRKSYKVLPGVGELLERLRRGRVPTGLGTGNLIESSMIKLKPSGLLDYFSFGGYGSDSEDRATLLTKAIERGSSAAGREIRPEEAIFFGDTIRDIEAVRRAGGKIIAVATGNNSLEQLQSADLVVQDLTDKKIFKFLELL